MIVFVLKDGRTICSDEYEFKNGMFLFKRYKFVKDNIVDNILHTDNYIIELRDVDKIYTSVSNWAFDKICTSVFNWALVRKFRKEVNMMCCGTCIYGENTGYNACESCIGSNYCEYDTTYEHSSKYDTNEKGE